MNAAMHHPVIGREGVTTIERDAWQSRIVEPSIEAPLALCQSDHLPLSEPAGAWAKTLLAARSLPRSVAPADALTVVEASRFNICKSVAELEHLYESAIGVNEN